MDRTIGALRTEDTTLRERNIEGVRPAFNSAYDLLLEVAQVMAGHEFARTTGLYDRRSYTVALDEIEKVVY